MPHAGEVHDEVAASLKFLGRYHVARDEFAAARKALAEELSIRTKLHGDHFWRRV